MYDELKSETNREEEADENYLNQNYYYPHCRYQAASSELAMSEVKQLFFQVGPTTAPPLVVMNSDEHGTFLPVPDVLELGEQHGNASSEVAT